MASAVADRRPDQVGGRHAAVRPGHDDRPGRWPERDRLTQDLLDRGAGPVRHEFRRRGELADGGREVRAGARDDVDRDAARGQQPQQRRQLCVKAPVADRVDDRGHESIVSRDPEPPRVRDHVSRHRTEYLTIRDQRPG